MAKSLSAIRYFGALGVLAAAAGAALAKPPEPGFWLTGLLPNANSGWVTALNKDGSVAAGYIGTTTPPAASSFTWTVAGGRNDFGLGSGMPAINFAYGLSDYGHIVGNMRVDGQYAKSRATRWTGTGSLQDLGVLPGETRSFAWGMSGDGNVVVGHAEHGSMSPLGQAIRWTPTKGMEGIGKLTPQSSISKAHAVSRDGLTIVGENWNEFLNTDAFVWTQAGGMKALPKLGNPWNTATADGVNADGTVIVGRSAPMGGGTHMVRWKNGVIEDLVKGTPYSGSWGLAVCDNAEIIAGTNTQGTFNVALAWSASTGAMELDDYLLLHGVQAPAGYRLDYAWAISGDGLTFGGQATNLATGVHEGFVATIPGKSCVADCDASGGLDIDDFICFQTRFAIADPYADCDASGELDIDDFICFQTAYAIGC